LGLLLTVNSNFAVGARVYSFQKLSPALSGCSLKARMKSPTLSGPFHK
jgi:hypothetical protein